jgi:transposase
MKSADNHLSSSPVSSKDIIAQLQRQLLEKEKTFQAQLDEKNTQLQEKAIQLKEKNSELQCVYEKLRLALQRQFGRRSEQLSDEAIKQLSLFDEDSDASADELTAIDKDEDNATVDVPAHTRQKKGAKKGFPAHFPREDITHDLAENDKQCHCGQPLKPIGEEVTEQVHIVPMQIKIVRHCVKKYACSVFDEHGVIRAKKPLSILGKSKGTAGSVAHVAVMKYQHHLPLYRQEYMLKQLGILLPRKTLCQWLIKASEGLATFFEVFQAHLPTCHYLQADETPMKILRPTELDKSGNVKNIKQGYLWVYRGIIEGQVIVLTQAHWSRASEHPITQLAGFDGILQSDGYRVYDVLAKANPAIEQVSCLAHIRRRFYELTKLVKNNKTGKAHQALSFIQKLYRADHLAKKQSATPAERLALRKQHAFKETVEKFQAWCEKSYIQVPPKSGIGSALAYTIKYLPRLSLCASHGEIELDNNLTENLIRPIALGRKNFLFLGGESGMKAASLFYSLIQTCKANQMNAYEYLCHLLTTITRHHTKAQLQALMPFQQAMVEKFQLQK